MNAPQHRKPGMDISTGINATATRAGSRCVWPTLLAFLAIGCLSLASTAWGQAADRVNLLGGASIAGKIIDVSPVGIDVESNDGTTQKVAIETVREVQFGGEPQSLKNARAMLLRGRAADARDEVGKIETDELDGAEPLVLAEVDFVKAAAAGQVMLDAGNDLTGAATMVADYLTKHPSSHHYFRMQELLGDLRARSGQPELAMAAYQRLVGGPPALQLRAALAKAAMLLAQGKTDDALSEYEAAIALAGNEKTSQTQKRSAEVGKARCLSLQGGHDAAVEMLKQIINDTNPEEKELLSRAYNVLGATYRAMDGREQDALIQFLMIDLVYNTLPETHAEALFNLAELWDKGSKPERAREARENLKAAYPASPWTSRLDPSKS